MKWPSWFTPKQQLTERREVGKATVKVFFSDSTDAVEFCFYGHWIDGGRWSFMQTGRQRALEFINSSNPICVNIQDKPKTYMPRHLVRRYVLTTELFQNTAG